MKNPSQTVLIGARFETAAVGVLLVLFAAFELFQPRSPGMLFGAGGGGLLMDLYLAGQISDLLKENSFWDLFWSGRLPSVRTHYHSTLMAYIYLPFLHLFGRSWMIAKHWTLLWAVGTLLFTYGFTRSLFGRNAGLLVTFLLVIHPTFVMGTRMGAAVLSHMQFFSMGALFFLERWWASRRIAWFGAALFFLGLGMCTQLWFYWIVAALAAAALTTDIRRALAPSRIRLLELAAVGLASFLAGAWLIVYREVVYKFHSAHTALQRFFIAAGSSQGPEHYEWEHVKVVFGNFNSLLAGHDFFDILRPFPSYAVDLHFGNWLYPAAFWLSAVFLLSKPGREKLGKRGLFLLMIWAVMFALSPLGPLGTPVFHFFFLYPLPAVIVAAAAANVFQGASERRALFMGIFLSCLVVGEVWTLARYFREWSSAQSTTFRSFYTESIYRVADWLREKSMTSGPIVVFGDSEEMTRHLYFVLPESEYKVHQVDYSFASEADLTQEAAKLRRAGTDSFLFIRLVHEIHPAFMFELERRFRPHARFELLHSFLDPHGNPEFETYLFRLKPK